jgi:hypothetical protein
MSYSTKAQFSTIRSAAVASIGAAYATIGSALTERAVILSFKNATNGDVFVSTDGTNNHLFFPANSFSVFDVKTNSPKFAGDLMFPVGTQFYVKDGPTAATTGTFYIEIVDAVYN